MPAPLRQRSGLVEGTPLVLIETDAGIVVLTRDQLKERVRREFADVDLVGELLADRRRAAAIEDG